MDFPEGQEAAAPCLMGTLLALLNELRSTYYCFMAAVDFIKDLLLKIYEITIKMCKYKML